MQERNIDICAGGNVGPGETSIKLVNNHGQTCHIDDLNLPDADPPGPYDIPAHKSQTITFSHIAGDYGYTPDCCSKPTAGSTTTVESSLSMSPNTHPVIKIQ
jgi:hypothetical protein